MKVSIKAGSIGTTIAAEVAHVAMAPVSDHPEPARVRALFLAANPPATTRLRLDEESRSIDQALQRGRHRDRFELATQWAVQLGDLQGHLLRYRPDIVHFSGHGADGALVLEDATGGPRTLQPADLRALLEQLGRNIRCVVLSACFTQPQAEEIARHIPCVIGTSRAISDTAAIGFATGFYEALAHGENVRTAFELGGQRIALAERGGGRRDVDAPVPASPSVAPILLGKADPRQIRFC